MTSQAGEGEGEPRVREASQQSVPHMNSLLHDVLPFYGEVDLSNSLDLHPCKVPDYGSFARWCCHQRRVPATVPRSDYQELYDVLGVLAESVVEVPPGAL